MATNNNQFLFEELDAQAVTVTHRLPSGYNSYDTTEEKMDGTKRAIKALLEDGRNVIVATSMGKDSAVLSTLSLMALEEFINESPTRPAPTMFFITSDTGVENPVVQAHAAGEMRKLQAYANRLGLPVECHTAAPGLSGDYLVNIIGGRSIFSRANIGRQCTVSLKVQPIQALKRILMKKIGKEASRKSVTLLGKRSDESVARGNSMAANGERSDKPVWIPKSSSLKSGAGEWVMSPISSYTLDDIFMVIGMVRSELISTFSDYESLVQVYRQANGGECMVNAFSKGEPERQPCGARTGCWTCHHTTKDRSLEEMLAEEENAYMRPLNDFREFTYFEHNKIENRNWLSRTVDAKGLMVLSPNAYHPDYCLQMLRICLTIDVCEMEAASALGVAPRFRLLSKQQILAIDMLWSRYGYQCGLAACQAYYDVYVLGQRYDVPEADTDAPKSLKETKKVAVSFTDEEYWHPTNGLFDIDAAAAGLSHDLRRIDGEFEVDAEGAEMFFAFELEHALERYGVATESRNPTAAFHYLTRLGVVSFRPGQENETGRMLRMANQIWRAGLHAVMSDPQALRERLVGTGEALPVVGGQYELI